MLCSAEVHGQPLGIFSRFLSLFAQGRMSGVPSRHRPKQGTNRPLAWSIFVGVNGEDQLQAAIDNLLGDHRILAELAAFRSSNRLHSAPDYAERISPNLRAGLPSELWLGIVRRSAYTCKLNTVEPLAWLTDVLKRIVADQTHTLLPWKWKQQDKVAPVGSG
jgi:hypothetical protein